MLLTVSDIEAARDELARSGVEISEVFHCATGTVCRFRDGEGVFERVGGSAPDRASYSSFASFSDLANAMRRAEAAHGEHEKRIGAPDPNWPDWYAEYMLAEKARTELPT
jgi:hypothetical protein